MSTQSYGTSSSQGTSTSTSTPVVDPINAGIAGLLTQLSATASGLASQTYQWAQQQFAKSSVVTDQMLRDADTYASQPRIASEMGRSETDTGQAMDAGRANAEQQLKSFGIDTSPGSGRYASDLRNAEAQKAAAQAGAGQVARQRTEDTGRQLRAQGINAELAAQNTGAAMKGVANQFLNTSQAALRYAPTAQQTTSSSQNSSTSQNASHSSNPSQQRSSSGGGGSNGGGGSTSSSSGGGGDSAYQRSALGGDNQYNQSDPSTIVTNQPDSASYSVPANYDWGSTPDNSGDQGYIANSGYGGNSYNDGGGGNGLDYYESSGGGYAEGGAIPDETTGGQVPQSASPSQGMQTDDVPAQLNAEEFVVPRDVARWKGEEFFQKLIDQSRKARMMGSAKGKPGQASQGPPTFASQAMGA